MTDELTAFADESIRTSAEPPMYLIAATIIPGEASLTGLESILPKGAAKLHWRDLGIRAQRNSLAKVAELGSRSAIVIASPIIPSRQERARRKNLETLLPLLERQGVDKVVVESRFPAADAKDASLHRALKRKGVITSIDLDFADPAVEHRLWIPDQILGAYAAVATGAREADSWKREWESISDSITTIRARL